MLDRIVVDTNVLVSALLKSDSAPRTVLRACLSGRCTPLMGNALLAEHEALLCRDTLFSAGPLSEAERMAFLDDYLSVCEWISVYFLWRPNLPDESDNHVLELAIAGGAEAIVTGNRRDFETASLRFPSIVVMTPAEFVVNWER